MPDSKLDQFNAAAISDPELAGAAVEAVRNRVFVPHPGGQGLVLQSPARFKVVRAGRRWGKTKVAARMLIREALKHPGTVNWWVANSYKNVARGYREVLAQLPPDLLAKPAPAVTAVTLELVLKNGSRIEFYSGGSPEALAGAGVNFVVVDEAALMPNGEKVWQQLIRPTLMDTKGRAILISTPRGRNWFWKLDNLGDDRDSPEWESWHFTSWDNPTLDPAEIKEIGRTMPKVVYEQEIMAAYIADAASIFALPKAAIGDLVEPDGHVVMGIDLGKKQDFTVLTASNVSGRQPCYHDRFNSIRWKEQRKLIHEAVEYIEDQPGVTGLTVAVDSNGVGDVVVDDLEDEGLDVSPVDFQGPWKTRAVRLLAADLERGEAFILPEQIPEFESYEYELTEAGRYKFSAATGHDDEVSAKLLEHWAMVHEGPADIHLVESEPATEVIEGGEPDSAADIMNRPEAWGY